MRTLMWQTQNRKSDPRLLRVVQTDTFGQVLFSYQLNCYRFGGPCISDCNWLCTGPVSDNSPTLMRVVCRGVDDVEAFAYSNAYHAPKKCDTIDLGVLYDPEEMYRHTLRISGRGRGVVPVGLPVMMMWSAAFDLNKKIPFTT